jgi:PTS system lactose-specific IIA component
MTKEEVTYKGLELVGLAGDARSNYLLALQAAKKGDFAKADALIAEGNEMIVEAHKAQTELIQTEAAGDYSDLTLLMVHGQDHLMTTILLKDILVTLLDVYKQQK